MNDTNLALLEKNRDILSIRDLATGTIATYTSYLTDYINWVEENLPGRSLSDVTWEEIRSYEKYLKDVRKLNPRTINVFISQLRDFYNYVLHKDWDRREVPLLRFDEKLPVVPTQEEVISIINAIDNPKHKAEIALLYSSGIRVNQACTAITFQPHPLFRIPDQLPQDILSEAHTHAAQHRLSRQSLPDNEQCSAHDGSVSQGCL